MDIRVGRPASIREAEQADFPSILNLINEFAVFQKTPSKVTITVAQMENEKDYFKCLVAETEDKIIIGFATYFFTYYSWSGKALYLDDLYVKEDYRQQKTGTRLLNAIIAIAKKEQCKKIRWQVSNWNKHAIIFYKKMGAQIDNTEMNCDLTL